MKHPIQPLETDESGVVRFRENKIVTHILEAAKSVNVDMNYLARIDFPQEDREQFAQLIGYSLCGFGDLGYVSDETYETAEKMHADGKTEDAARIEYLEETLGTVRAGMKGIIPALFRIHPDDLEA